MQEHRHNKTVIEQALRRAGGTATLGSLSVYCSDDESLIRAAKQSGIKYTSRLLTTRSAVSLVKAVRG